MPADTVTYANAIKTEYERNLLERALARLIHGRYASVARITERGSYELRKYGSLAAITAALDEGVTPAGQGNPALTLVTMTPVWYGSWMRYTDKLELTSFDSTILWMSGVLGEQSGLSVDTIVRNVITDGATKDYPGAASVDTRAEVTDPITYNEFVDQVAALESANARPVAGLGMYAVIMHPNTWAALMKDSDFKTVFSREASGPNSATAVRSGYVGHIFNCALFVTSNSRVYAGAGAGASDVYSMLLIGEGAYGTCGISNLTPDLMGLDDGREGFSNRTGRPVKAVELVLKGLGESGDDPLNQRGSAGWKLTLDCKIKEITWIRDFEHNVV